MFRKMHVYDKIDAIMSWPHFFPFLFFFLFSEGETKVRRQSNKFSMYSAYLIHDAKDDLHYQVATSFLYGTIAAASFIYTPSLQCTCFSSNI